MATVCPRIYGVFPAYAGMFLNVFDLDWEPVRFPRIRGDVPSSGYSMIVLNTFSPHTRGCSFGYRVRYPVGGVFPAYAGMFLSVRFRMAP